MILWLILFILIVAISFVLAYQSMRDYSERSENFKIPFAVYLIRHPAALTNELINRFHQLAKKEGLIISLEKLFKGQKSAYVIFGPSAILQTVVVQLNLLELEDYTAVPLDQVYAFEMSFKAGDQVNFAPLDKLADSEQFWYQLVLQPQGGDKFKVQIRGVLISAGERRKELSGQLEHLGGVGRVPRPFSSAQLLNFYKSRTLSAGATTLKMDQVLRLFS